MDLPDVAEVFGAGGAAGQFAAGGARDSTGREQPHVADGQAVSVRHRFPDREWIARIQPDCTVTGDPFLLHLLVSNLLDNALKYSPKDGAVTLMLTKEGADTVLAIKDNGPGIPDEEKKKVFGKFYRSGQESTRQTKGTGLGLYLCRKIAADHGASIKVADNSPTGSIFTVIF